MENNLTELLKYGQSYWLDNLTRKKITSGELQRRVSEQGLRGITSNPAIFNKAITGSSDYDDQIKELAAKGKTATEIYDALTIRDVQDACDILLPVFNEANGEDGFVSLEVSPYLALDARGAIEQARKLYKGVDRPNCFIKIPGTKEGVAAIEQCLYEGINVNITLLFSLESYTAVAEAYKRALEKRLAEHKPIDKIVSVASFFLSRIDVLADQLLNHYILPAEKTDKLPETLLGKVAIASAKMAYQRYKQIFSGGGWEKLKAKGAHVQKLLWASTSNKDPLYDDLRYVEQLIGPDTVNTLPDETIDILASRGTLKEDAIENGIDDARQVFEELKNIGINIDFITQQLENEGIQKFMEAYNELIAGIQTKIDKTQSEGHSSQQIVPGVLKKEIESAYASLDNKQVGRRLFEKDAYLWKTEPDQVKTINDGLGWLTLPESFDADIKDILAFTERVRSEGFTHTVLLGMGGSSLCSEVARETFTKKDGYLELLVLDNTDPAAIIDVQNKVALDKTLFIAATKSGGTAETISFFRYFYQVLEQAGVSNPGNNFVAITDDGSPLVKMAEDFKFRKTFINPSDVGGRYSVLSDFGLLPMALMGIDIESMMNNALQMRRNCDGAVPAAVNPGMALGAVMGVCQKHGRDKVTLVLSESIKSFGYWAEQLLAESTGKEGKGLIPVNGESLGSPEVYGKDRLFVHMYLASDDINSDERKLKLLEAAGHPIVRIKVANKIALGGEYYRWEIATAIAGVVIGINAFDQPNVTESKNNTKHILEGWEKKQSFDKESVDKEISGMKVYLGQSIKDKIDGNTADVHALIENFAAMAKPNDYIALLPYFQMTDEREQQLQTIRQKLRDKYKVATTLLNGPRYLHSTGQLHKGGPDSGLYIILSGSEEGDLPIPGQPYGFATLHKAQYLGDYRSLDDKKRRVLRLDLDNDINGGLKVL